MARCIAFSPLFVLILACLHVDSLSAKIVDKVCYNKVGNATLKPISDANVCAAPKSASALFTRNETHVNLNITGDISALVDYPSCRALVVIVGVRTMNMSHWIDFKQTFPKDSSDQLMLNWPFEVVRTFSQSDAREIPTDWYKCSPLEVNFTSELFTRTCTFNKNVDEEGGPASDLLTQRSWIHISVIKTMSQGSSREVNAFSANTSDPILVFSVHEDTPDGDPDSTNVPTDEQVASSSTLIYVIVGGAAVLVVLVVVVVLLIRQKRKRAVKRSKLMPPK